MMGKTYLGRKLSFIKLPNFHWIFYNVCLISTLSTNTISFSVNYIKTCSASVCIFRRYVAYRISNMYTNYKNVFSAF